MSARLACFLPLLASLAVAGERLHCVVIEVPSASLPLLREEMKRAAAPVADHGPVLLSTDGLPRRVTHRGQAPFVPEKPIPLGNGPREGSPAGARSFNIVAASGAGGGLVYDVSIQQSPVPASYYDFRTKGLVAAVPANRWQELAAWNQGTRSVSLWHHLQTDEPRAAAGDELRIELIFASMPDDALAHVPEYPPELTRQVVGHLSGTGRVWKSFSLACRADVPFHLQSSHGDRRRRQEPGYGDRVLAKFQGRITRDTPGHATLDGLLEAPRHHEGDAEAYPVSSEASIGEWRLIVLRDGPTFKAAAAAFHEIYTRRAHVAAKVNVVAIRVSVADEGEP
ncbi:hypothetical protein [Luteolibacter marinus]|uniref:hypothetical protein n=1 Tax=Luteolibacter marinus TaxID=2776705 RepID=UPI0018679820|nr:hypothetical protein [Luteolibacter marinus]